MSVRTSQHSRAADLKRMAAIVAAIVAEQRDHPAYAQEVLEAVVHTELRQLEREMGVGLDELLLDREEGAC